MQNKHKLPIKSWFFTVVILFWYLTRKTRGRILENKDFYTNTDIGCLVENTKVRANNT